MEGVQQLLGHFVLLALVEEQPAAGLAANKDVFGHGQLLHQVKLLVNDADAMCLRVSGTVDFDFLAEILNDAFVLGVDTGEDFHQCRLAGAVFADQCQYLAGADFQLGVVQRVDTWEVLLDAVHSQNRIAHFVYHLPVKILWSAYPWRLYLRNVVQLIQAVTEEFLQPA